MASGGDAQEEPDDLIDLWDGARPKRLSVSLNVDKHRQASLEREERASKRNRARDEKERARLKSQEQEHEQDREDSPAELANRQRPTGASKAPTEGPPIGARNTREDAFNHA